MSLKDHSSIGSSISEFGPVQESNDPAATLNLLKEMPQNAQLAAITGFGSDTFSASCHAPSNGKEDSCSLRLRRFFITGKEIRSF